MRAPVLLGSGSVAPGLYIHVPFCTSICPYCDFAVTIAGSERREGFVGALLQEAALCREWHEQPFDSLYLGGGTPSSLDLRQLEELVVGIRTCLPVASDARLFIECNPEDVTADNLSVWLALGVHTVSIGVQSLDDGVLSFLGRRHDARQARRAVELALEEGVASVSVDLIYGFAGHDLWSWRAQLEQAVALSPHHLSCYQLTIHQDTVFGRRSARGENLEVSEDAQADLFVLTHEMLGDAGYQAYEVSNFAANVHHQSVHNRKYWEHVPYLGLGPAAHSFDGRRRWWNLSKVRLWERAVRRGLIPAEDEEHLSAAQLASESLMLGLRTLRGVDLGHIQERHGLDLEDVNQDLIHRLVEQGLARRDGHRLVPTLQGMAVADGLAQAFVIPEGAGLLQGER